MSTYVLIQDRSELDLIRHWVEIITIIKLFIFLVKTEWEVLQGPQAGQSGGFSFSVIKRGDTNNPVGSNVTPVLVNQIPGLTTLGISAAHIDFAPYGQNLFHTHPRATEILVVLEGAPLVGFATSNPNNTLISKVLNKGDVFVFPIGLIHFQFNIGKTNPLAVAALSSQNPGVITIANAVFGSYPPVNREFLAKAFMLDVNVVKDLQKKFWVAN